MAVKGEAYGSAHQTNSLSYTWVLRDFREIVRKYRNPGAEVKSECLDPKKEGISKVYLSLYPGGSSEKDSEYVSLFVRSSNAREKIVYQKHTLSLRTSTGKTVCSQSARYRMVEVQSVPGSSRLVKLEKLLEQLDDDVLVVVLELAYSSSIEKKRADVAMGVPEREPVPTADEDVLPLMIAGKHSDVRIIVQETEIPAYKFILAAKSKVFAAMFDHELLESSTQKVEITDFDVRTVRSMLHFLYSGVVEDMDTSLALDLLRAADKYDIGKLKNFCSSFLTWHMDGENVLQVLVAAQAYHAEGLKKEAMEYVCRNHGSLDYEDSISELVNYPELLVDIILNV